MGKSHSNLRVTARVSVQGKGCPVDGITLSYAGRRSCFGGRRRRLVAAFTFPRQGWSQVSSEDTRHNISSKVAVVSLGHLKNKDGNTTVQINCMSDGVPVYTTEVTVADLLQSLRLTTRGKEAAVFFSLSGGKPHEGNTQAHTYTALFCNGRRCGDGGAATPADTPHCRQAQPGREADEGQQKWDIFEAATASDWTCNDDEAMALDLDVIEQKFNIFDVATAPDWTCDDDEAMALEPAVLEQKWNDFEAASASDWACEDDGKDEEAVVECQDGISVRDSLKDSLRYMTCVAAVMLVLYNAWLEYTRE